MVTGTLVFAVAFLSHAHLLPATARSFIPALVALMLAGTALFVNEALHCDAMMRWRPAPYHALVELVVSAFLVTFALMFVRV